MAAEISPGRRLRLDRRKAGLSQEALAKRLGVDKEAVSKMERDLRPLTNEAKAFSASPPTPVPPGPAVPRPPADAEPGAGPEPLPSVDEPGDGPGPRVDDAPPRAGAKPVLAPSRGEIAELESALLKLFAGEEFLVPRSQPDGTVTQVSATIPGIAQMVGMVDEFDGLIIKTYAPGMAKAWAELARVNPTVRKVLVGLTYGGAYRGVMAATAPVILALVAHHGLLPGFGGPPAVVVEHAPAAGGADTLVDIPLP